MSSQAEVQTPEVDYNLETQVQTVHEVTYNLLRRLGLTTVLGNPGSTEQLAAPPVLVPETAVNENHLNRQLGPLFAARQELAMSTESLEMKGVIR